MCSVVGVSMHCTFVFPVFVMICRQLMTFDGRKNKIKMRACKSKFPSVGMRNLKFLCGGLMFRLRKSM